MDRFKVTMTLGSPLVTNGGYMTLDALLAALIFDQTGDLEQAHSAIPLQATEGLWHGSAAIVEKLDSGRISFVASLRATHDLQLDDIAKNRQGNTHTSMGLTRRREFGAVMNSYGLCTAARVTWYGQGKVDEVERLLTEVSFIGKRRASGFGQVTGLHIEADELDGITGLFGEPLRPVPVALFKGDPTALRADAAWRPAYWHPANRSICFVPEASR